MTRITRPAYGENTGVINSSLKAIFPVAIFSSRNPFMPTAARVICCVCCPLMRTLLVSASTAVGTGGWMSDTPFVLLCHGLHYPPLRIALVSREVEYFFLCQVLGVLRNLFTLCQIIFFHCTPHFVSCLPRFTLHPILL